MMPTTAKKLLLETVQFLVGLVALASLTWLRAWLGFPYRLRSTQAF
jgi:hypothetical protein